MVLRKFRCVNEVEKLRLREREGPFSHFFLSASVGRHSFADGFNPAFCQKVDIHLTIVNLLVPEMRNLACQECGHWRKCG
jgi:hypothetical protein